MTVDDEAPLNPRAARGYPGKVALNRAGDQLRRALTALARHRDPDVQAAGVQITDVAVELLADLTRRANEAHPSYKRLLRDLDRQDARVADLRARHAAKTGAHTSDAAPAPPAHTTDQENHP